MATIGTPRRTDPPRTVRMLLYVAPHKVPEDWREWAVERVRSAEWILSSAAWPTLLVAGGLWIASVAGSFSEHAGTWALYVVALFGLMVVTGERRRRTVIRAIVEGSWWSDMPLRLWHLPLALGMGTLVVLFLYLFIGT